MYGTVKQNLIDKFLIKVTSLTLK